MRRLMLVLVLLLNLPVLAQDDDTLTVIEEGVQLVIHVDETDTVQEVVQVILQRAEELELDDVRVQIIGEDTIQMQFPGLDRLSTDALNTLTRRGLLELVDFRGIEQDLTGERINTSAQVARGIVDLDAAYQPFTGQPFLTILTSEAFESVRVVQGTTLNTWNILFTIRQQDQERFRDFTRRHIGEKLAIVLDGEVITAPTIHETLQDSGLISANFDFNEANNLAIQLRFGELPSNITVISTDTYQTLGFGN
ncbi:MAG: hypothetical protein D6711_04840 [Chloroflexi bacterium]|nr:MAG: hypothetical protein D6711_04840 [Chloroflexota bacterium]